VIAEPRGDASLVYDVQFDNVAALRLVSSVLELRDAEGAPRLRVMPPFAVDATGARHAASLAVEGCAVDTDASDPRDRPVVALESNRCKVVVTWEAGLAYPILVDPAWTAGGAMITPRAAPSADGLGSGKVLVCGGDVYDPIQ